MPWTAPEVTRPAMPRVADERTMLEAWLDWHRQTLLMKCTGLGAEQLKRRSAPPSTLTLHGLVRHMAEVERDWFRICCAGQALSALYSTATWPTADFDDLEAADPATDFVTFAEEVRLARAVTGGRSLDDTFVHPQRGMAINLRWVYVHMIEDMRGITAMRTCSASALTGPPERGGVVDEPSTGHRGRRRGHPRSSIRGCISAEHRTGADARQLTLRSSFRARLTAGVRRLELAIDHSVGIYRRK
jgi:uncharacterized damage-inducible protein DinB